MEKMYMHKMSQLIWTRERVEKREQKQKMLDKE